MKNLVKWTPVSEALSITKQKTKKLKKDTYFIRITNPAAFDVALDGELCVAITVETAKKLASYITKGKK